MFVCMSVGVGVGAGAGEGVGVGVGVGVLVLNSTNKIRQKNDVCGISGNILVLTSTHGIVMARLFSNFFITFSEWQQTPSPALSNKAGSRS